MTPNARPPSARVNPRAHPLAEQSRPGSGPCSLRPEGPNSWVKRPILTVRSAEARRKTLLTTSRQLTNEIVS
jgi:hypothetical protein